MASGSSEPTNAASRPRLLDLFCGAGGAAMGYHRAGFDVVGVDIKPQPSYPFRLIEMDALLYLRTMPLHDFDAIHASPPCQAFTNARVIHGNEHPDLLTPTRELLLDQDLPWVIENVPGAPMRRDLILCGSMFPELRDGDYGIVRHRWFEFSCPWIAPVLVPPCNHPPKVVSVFGHGGHIYHGKAQWERVMGIEWMKRDEIALAIPPVFTELIGRRLLEHIAEEVAA